MRNKKEKMRNKKGISPLIATVLIIGFTIALALVIFAWGRTFTETLTKETGEKAEQQLSCSDLVSFEVKKACYKGSDVEFTLENSGDITLDKVTLRISGEKEAQVDIKELEIGLVPLGRKTYTAQFDQQSVGSVVTKIELLRPIFTDGGEEVVCRNLGEEVKVSICE